LNPEAQTVEQSGQDAVRLRIHAIDRIAPKKARWKSAAKRASMASILETVAAYYGIQQADILGRRQFAQFTEPRHIAMYLAAELTDLSMARIGMYFARHHTTVLSARDAVSNAIASDFLVAAKVQVLHRQLTEAVMPAADVLEIRTSMIRRLEEQRDTAATTAAELETIAANCQRLIDEWQRVTEWSRA
jgi:Bacterial dnaA protein helix-turn-helix